MNWLWIALLISLVGGNAKTPGISAGTGVLVTEHPVFYLIYAALVVTGEYIR